LKRPHRHEHQVLEQAVFEGGQVDGRAGDAHFLAPGIQLEQTALQQRLRPSG
jgi:hypothetical protein